MARDIRRPGTDLRHDVGLLTLSIEDEAGGCSVRKKMTLAVGHRPSAVPMRRPLVMTIPSALSGPVSGVIDRRR